MEILKEFVDGNVTRWTLPFLLSVAVYMFASFLGGHLSDASKKDLVFFLKSDSYRTYLGSVPKIILELFCNYYGNDHFSKKCFFRSLTFSAISFLFVTLVSVVFAPHEWAQYLAFVIKMSAKAWLVAIALWILACGFPSYFLAGKTRFVLWVLVKSDAGIWETMSALACDLIFSSWIFLTVLSVTLVVGAVIYNIDVGKNPHNVGLLSELLGGGIVSAIIVILGMMTLISTGLLYFSVPLANLFWACAAPSAWLWLYLLAFLFTRFLLRVSPSIKRVLGVLDVEQKPLECVGLVAGGLVLVSSFVVNSIYLTLRI